LSGVLEFKSRARTACQFRVREGPWLEFSARLSDEARGQIGAKTVAVFSFGMETSGAGLEASLENFSFARFRTKQVGVLEWVTWAAARMTTKAC